MPAPPVPPSRCWAADDRLSRLDARSLVDVDAAVAEQLLAGCSRTALRARPEIARALWDRVSRTTQGRIVAGWARRFDAGDLGAWLAWLYRC